MLQLKNVSVFTSYETKQWFFSTDSQQQAPPGFGYVTLSGGEYQDVNDVEKHYSRMGFEQISNPEPEFQPKQSL